MGQGADGHVMTDTQASPDVAAGAAPTVGVVRESGADERRVALVPKAVAALVNSGLAVVVESGAGEAALLPDDLYTEAGATIGDAWAADVVVKVAPPSAAEVGKLRSGPDQCGDAGDTRLDLDVSGHDSCAPSETGAAADRMSPSRHSPPRVAFPEFSHRGKAP